MQRGVGWPLLRSAPRCAGLVFADAQRCSAGEGNHTFTPPDISVHRVCAGLRWRRLRVGLPLFVSNNLPVVPGIAGDTVSLFREASPADTAMGSFAFNGNTGNISYAFATLSCGDHYYALAATGAGSMGGFHTVSSTVSAVPEPGPCAMLLPGLGVIRMLSMRRQSR